MGHAMDRLQRVVTNRAQVAESWYRLANMNEIAKFIASDQKLGNSGGVS